MKKKTWLRILAGIGIYLLLLCGFWIAESRAAGSPSPSMTDSLSQTAADSSPTSSADSYAESSSVSSPEPASSAESSAASSPGPASSAESSAASSPQAESEKITPGSALWYSLVTLTTVGYGDIVPHTLPGKIIGGIFAICSTFLLAFVIGMMLSLWRGRLQPMIRLMKSKGKRWFIFQEDNIRTRTLGRNLLSENPRNVKARGLLLTPMRQRSIPDSALRRFCIILPIRPNAPFFSWVRTALKIIIRQFSIWIRA